MNIESAGTNTTSTTHLKHPGRSYLWLTLVLLPLVLIAVIGRPWGASADIWETSAAIRSLTADLAHPSNPLLDLPGTTSCRFTPFTLLWGALMKATGLGLFSVIALAGLTNYFLFVTGLWRFVRLQFRSRDLPACVLLCMLFVWGREYGQANEYQLGMFLLTLPYVAVFAYGCTFHALAALRSFLDTRRFRHLALYAVLAAVAFLTHPITGAFLFLAALVLVRTQSGWRLTAALQIVPLAVVIVSRLWPYFDYWAVLRQGSTESWFESPMSKAQIMALGPALVGAPIAFYYALKRRHPFVVWGAALCAAVYVISLAGHVLIGGRFIFFTGFFLQLAIALYAAEHNLFNWTSLRESLRTHGFPLMIVFMLIVPAAYFRATELVWQKPLRLPGSAVPSQPFLFLRDHLHSGDIVMGEGAAVWLVPALTGAKVVTSLKGNPLIIEETKRRAADTERFLHSALSTSERRALLQSYRVTHILLNDAQDAEADSTFRRDLAALARLEISRGHLKLYEVVPPLPPNSSPHSN
jgi:hypothetical protein